MAEYGPNGLQLPNKIRRRTYPHHLGRERSRLDK